MSLSEKLDVTLGLQETHVLITGGAGQIGSYVVSAFLSAGAKVTCIDISEDAIAVLKNLIQAQGVSSHDERFKCLVADVSSETSTLHAFETAAESFGTIQCCVALAALDMSVLDHHSSLLSMSFAQWKKTFDVNVHGTFLTAKMWLTSLIAAENSQELRNRSLVIVGSESGLFGERGNADYAASKGAIQGGLLQSLKADVPRQCPGARVNAIALGTVDTPRFRQECKDDAKQLWKDAGATTALKKPVDVTCVARSILYLASDSFSGSVHGHILRVDSGKEGALMYTEDEMKP